MNEVVYVIEDYDTGDMTGYWDKDKALLGMVHTYVDTGFGNMYEAIIKAAKENKPDEVKHLLDTIKDDFDTLLGESHYIDCLMGMREIIIEG